MDDVQGARAAALAAVLLSGCGVYAQGSAGYTTTPANERAYRGAPVNLHAGVNLDDRRAAKLGLLPAAGVNLRGRVTAKNQQGGPGLEAMGRLLLDTHDAGRRAGPLTPMELYARAGFSLLQLGNDRGHLAASAFSPMIELGTVWMLGHEDVPYYTLSAFAERDVRFTEAPGQTFFGLLLGGGLMKVTGRR